MQVVGKWFDKLDFDDNIAGIMLDMIPVGVHVWNQKGEMIASNKEWLNIFGLKTVDEANINFYRLSPEYQPDGGNSKEKAEEYIKHAFEHGYTKFEWMHQTLDEKTLIPSEIVLNRTENNGQTYVIASIRDLTEEKLYEEKIHEADERSKVMLDATPLCCNLWNKEFHNIDCNEEAVKLFGLKDKQEYLDRFFELSPEFQPDGMLSEEKAAKFIKDAFETGSCKFEWMHQKLNGEQIPSEIILVRVTYGKDDVVAGYTRDLREQKEAMAQLRAADERTKVVLDATPMCTNLWNKDFENIDCNEEAVKLFELKNKQEYLDRFFELSPELQPDGAPSNDKAAKYIAEAFENGSCKFEWMHQKLNGEQIPAEITLVKVKYGNEDMVAGYTRDLREEKETMAKLREADERTQVMLDATPLCCNLWDKDFHNIDCNEEAVKLFELKNKQEYLDRFFELSPEYQPNGELTEKAAQNNIKTAFNEGFCKFEWMHQKLNGEQIPAEITLVRVKYGDEDVVAGYTRDLREQKEAIAKLREADERTQLMLDATPLCCNLWNRDFENIDCNEEAVKLFELKDKQEYLDRFFELSPEYQPNGKLTSELAMENIKTAFNDGYVRFEWMHQKLNGEQIPAEITLVRVKYKDDYIVAGYTRDLREQKAMIADMHRVQEDLRLARDKAEESAQAKSDFVANMSHEIRTPMNGILGMLHLVMKTQLSDKQQNYLRNMEMSANNLLRIINDILDFSKIEAGKLEMEKTLFKVSNVIEEIKSMFAPRVKEKGLDFTVDFNSNDDGYVFGDSLRLKQILINLIGNAIKFTDEGQITIHVKKVSTAKKNIEYEFSVEDTGIGMKKKQVDALFTPFTQGDASITREYGGTGLGLTISRNLVDMMNGRVWVESEYEHGSTFYFTALFESSDDIDIKPYSNRNVHPSSEKQFEDEMASGYILLVEDIEINQMLAVELLELAGYTVDVAANGVEALDFLKKNKYDAVLMDIQMPIMDGLTATKKIRENKDLQDLPIIAMSANAMSGDRERSLEYGMNDHLSKPVEPQALYDILKKWIRK